VLKNRKEEKKSYTPSAALRDGVGLLAGIAQKSKLKTWDFYRGETTITLVQLRRTQPLQHQLSIPKVAQYSEIGWFALTPKLGFLLGLRLIFQ
jgi:hypothetical protein